MRAPGTPRWGLGARHPPEVGRRVPQDPLRGLPDVLDLRAAGRSARCSGGGLQRGLAGQPPGLSRSAGRRSAHPVVPSGPGTWLPGRWGEGSALLGTDRWRRVGAPGLVLIGFRSIEGRPAAAASSAIPRRDAWALEGHGQQEAGESCINAGLNTSPRPRVCVSAVQMGGWICRLGRPAPCTGVNRLLP